MQPILLGLLNVAITLQATQASVVGTVRDAETGRPLASVSVLLPDLERSVSTDREGRYYLRQVPPGPHHLTVRSIGFAARTLHALVPRSGELEINVSLRPEPVRLRTLEVTSVVPMRGVENPDRVLYPDRAISSAAIWTHPLLAEPDAFEALAGGEVVLRLEAPTGVHVRGGAADHTAYSLDGIPVFSPYHAGGVFSAWNPDAVARLQLSSALPSPFSPEALSGTLAGFTRAPSPYLHTQGSLSTSQGRLTLDGPLGRGAGFLISLRSGFPDALAPRDEGSYLNGETGDLLGKLEAAVARGFLRLLVYESENELNTAAVALDDGAPDPTRRNLFEWKNQSLGAEWTRGFGNRSLRLTAWRATSAASSRWADPADLLNLDASRRDHGAQASFAHRSSGTSTSAGLRAEVSATAYHIQADAADAASSEHARTRILTVFAQQERALTERLDLVLGAALAHGAGRLHFGPRAQLRFSSAEPLTLSASYARTHQFAQSLRNAESLVGTVFPVDLFVGAGAPGIPVARSEQAVLAADYRPIGGVRLGLQAYARDLHGLVLVAPNNGHAFASDGFSVGSGAATGVSFDAAVSARRYGLIASYGWQRIHYEHGGSGYTPEHGATHLLETGVVVFPTPTFSARLGLTGAFGRRTTSVSSAFEWEACNLLDRGCEFGGSPDYGAAALGGTALPSYLRLDLGLRKHVHIEVGGRDALIAIFGTVTNILGRTNVLTYAVDPGTGNVIPIDMRPRAPLVVGLDWRF